MRKRAIVAISLLLVCVLSMSQVVAAASPTSTTRPQEGEWVSVAIDGRIFAYPRCADPNVVIGEINRVLGKSTATSLDELTSSAHTCSGSDNATSVAVTWLAVKVLAARFCLSVGPYPAFKMCVVHLAPKAWALIDGVMQQLKCGNGRCRHGGTPLFEVWQGLLVWY